MATPALAGAVTDADNDGVSDLDDDCASTPAGETPDANGCSPSQLDDDDDGVKNDLDACPGTPPGAFADPNGCAASQLDDDGDGVANDADLCSDTPSSEPVDPDGCADTQVDLDDDGVINSDDLCSGTPSGEPVDGDGCAESQLDDDDDGVMNDLDLCPDTPSGAAADPDGCAESQLDDDEDGVYNDADLCSSTPSGEPVDEVGCSDTQIVPVDLSGLKLFGGGAGSGTEWQVSNTSCPTVCGLGMIDAELDPDDDSSIGSQGDAFDGGLVASVGGTGFADSDDEGAQVGESLTTGPADIDDLTITRNDTALQETGTLRSIISLHNPGLEPISTNVGWTTDLGSDGSEEVRASSSGDDIYAVSDRWLVSSDNSSSPSDPVLTFVLFGSGGPEVATTDVIQAPGGSGAFAVGFDVTVPAGATRSLLLFTQMNQTNGDGADAAAAFDDFGRHAEFIDDLSDVELDEIANWNFDSMFDNDGDGITDVDDPDDDNDGDADEVDNCQFDSNPGQEDTDVDGVGDVCEDSDGDGVYDPIDNCPADANHNQGDADEDGSGDICDNDIDGDEVLNDEDNCPEAANPDQADSDEDDLGNACDDDSDNDGSPDDEDPCPTDPEDACPQPESDFLQVYELSGGHQGSLNVLWNDNDNYGNGLTVTDNGDGENGSVECSESGSCTYTADEDFTQGTDEFIYSVEDAFGDEGNGSVEVEVIDGPPCAGEEGACIDNGLVMLGVHPEGHLNVSGGPSSTYEGTDVVGLRYIPNGGDSTSPGCTCEGWGAADAISEVSGFANDSSGIENVESEEFHSTASDAFSVSNVGTTLEVTHDYHPSADTDNLYEVTVTLRNISEETIDARYSRAMDWDIEPTAFDEFSTIFGGSSESLLHSSANGFSTADPLRNFANDDSGYASGSFTDAGPTDHGAVFDFGFGLLEPGQEVSFNTYYGAAGNESDAIDALIEVGAEVFSLGQPNTLHGADLGTPNTYIFGFSGVEGEGLSDRPFAVTDEIVVDETSTGSVNVLDNDTDFPFNEIDLIEWTDGALGEVECITEGADAGECSYAGGPAFYAGDLFRYVIEDDEGNRDTGAVRVSAPDSDGDGVPNPGDNCPDLDNTNQDDSDEDGTGDVCDDNSDSDADGFVDASDNCPDVYNPSLFEEPQADANEDGQGDACEPDLDLDGVPDDPDESLVGTDGSASGDEDNCLGVFNPVEVTDSGIAQPDLDNDGKGDACDDSDVDGDTPDPDGIMDSSDNCPFVANADQLDADADGDGAACDADDADAADPDYDGVPSKLDTCDNAWNPGDYQKADKDNDGIPDACDPVEDLCPATILPNATFENAGFETSDLSGWKKGIQTEGVNVTDGGGGFTAPYEGGYMARLGQAHGSYAEGQPIGPNALCQAFTIPTGSDPLDLQRFFAFNVFTYDYKGYDSLRFEATLLDDSGSPSEVLASVVSDAWGSGVNLKTTGWQVIELNLDDADRGKTVLLSFTAGGTTDQLFGTWAYIDSASGPEPSLAEVEAADVSSATGSVTTNTLTGDLLLAMPYGNKSTITMPFDIDCPDGTSLVTTPAPKIQLMNGGSVLGEFDLTHVGGALWQLTIEPSQIASGDLVLFANCSGDGETTSLQDTVMTITLYDPSGTITDSSTSLPVEGATVTLFNVPGWTAATAPGDTGDQKCQSNFSKPGGAGSVPWSQVAPIGLGVPANPFNGTIDPATTTQTTTAIGKYGWSVAAGCWYVTVSAVGYEPLTSPVVGVPSEVTDLNLVLTPLGGGEPTPPDPEPGSGGGNLAQTLTVAKSGTGAGKVVSTPAGIDCGSTCAAQFLFGYGVTLIPTAADGSTFTGWAGACSGSLGCTVTMNQARSVTAIFDKVGAALVPLSVSKSGAGSGTITSSPTGIQCGAVCAADYAVGTTVVLTATPDEDSRFKGWTGACEGKTTCLVTMDEARAANAIFSIKPDVLGSFEAVSKLHLERKGKSALQATSDSARNICDTDRAVVFKKRRPGDDRILGTRNTDESGVAILHRLGRDPHGVYYAKVAEVTIKNTSGLMVTCSGDKSNLVTLGGPR